MLRGTATNKKDLVIECTHFRRNKPVMIGRIGSDGQIVPVSITDDLVPPEPWSPWLSAPCGMREPPPTPAEYRLDKRPGTLLKIPWSRSKEAETPGKSVP
jgi:hypothetical protein